MPRFLVVEKYDVEISIEVEAVNRQEARISVAHLYCEAELKNPRTNKVSDLPHKITYSYHPGRIFSLEEPKNA